MFNAKGEPSDDNVSSYEKLRKSYDHLYRNVSSMSSKEGDASTKGGRGKPKASKSRSQKAGLQFPLQLNYLAVASDPGKVFGWSSGLALMYLPQWVVLFMAAFMGSSVMVFSGLL
ncbi:putative NODULIN-LIKE PROTEIN [Salix purpurea]|uniref:NODULIN-LIKE PROTEIN n=1 Tax=Salix purpurea TaxID=77065 RepID=A0A9Q0V2U9_SALPP|nr:putative NODULIN-LIKE PROTEIN [Salix purpurea]